ncbi:6-phosphogluconolactonase [Kiritimatiellota bacterium B12222]|nr:6-phosphogluconolactonase [Kiritimatiellota bacterium B12222]
MDLALNETPLKLELIPSPVEITVAHTPQQLGRSAAAFGAERIRKAIKEKGHASVFFSTGASQFDTLRFLTKEPGINWKKVTGFHVDEYIGITQSHPSSLGRFIRQRLVEKTYIQTFHFLNSAADPIEECQRLSKVIRKHTIDVGFIGIGNCGRLAFNDPPADFESTTPFKIAELNREMRLQQLGGGWFHTFKEVPKYAYTMSIQEILRARCLVCSAPHARKAKAVKKALKGPITPELPASILRTHDDMHLFLDHASACKIQVQS